MYIYRYNNEAKKLHVPAKILEKNKVGKKLSLFIIQDKNLTLTVLV